MHSPLLDISPELTGHEYVTVTAIPSLQATKVNDFLKNLDHFTDDIVL